MVVVCLECYTIRLMEIGLAQVLRRHWKLITMHFLVAHTAYVLELNTTLPQITRLHTITRILGSYSHFVA